jgi:hypothetical protein
LSGNKPRDIFRKMARVAAKSEKKDWNKVVKNGAKIDRVVTTWPSLVAVLPMWQSGVNVMIIKMTVKIQILQRLAVF